jgi:hypothetical protein
MKIWSRDVSLSFEAISLLTMAWKGLKIALHLGLGAEDGLKKAICSASNSTGISPTSDLWQTAVISVVVPHRFDTDPDPDPAPLQSDRNL